LTGRKVIGAKRKGVLNVSLELWLFAAVMEVIVIGTFFGGTFLAYRVGQRQSRSAAEPVEARITPVPQQAGVSDARTETDDRPARAA
jgi:hypothetical protein